MRRSALAILMAALFCLLIQPAWADRGYRLTLTTAAKAGAVELAPGDYTLHLHDGNVVLSDVKNGAQHTLEGKVDSSAEQKFRSTSIQTGTVDGNRVIQEIRLGGTRTIVTFAQK